MNDFDFEQDLKALAAADEPDPASLDRLEYRVLASASRHPRPSAMRRFAPVALLAAAALAFVLWPRAGSPPRAFVLGEGSVSLDDGVSADVEGRGSAVAEDRGTTVSWVEGSITLEVDPNRVGGQDREVRVETDEALVRVLGTVLTVDRGPFGTEVSVERGKVETTCLSHHGPPEIVMAGEHSLCLRDAGSGLGYLLLLERQRAPASERLLVIERARSIPGGLAATRQQLDERRIDALVELGRTDDAIAMIERMPLSDRVGQLSAGANEAMLAGGCDRAEPWLEALVDAGEVTGALLQVQCLAESDPARAREVLDTIDRETLAPALEASVQQWDDALP